nr:SH3 domain-containing protein [uncultured Pseudomonas sp.]
MNRVLFTALGILLSVCYSAAGMAEQRAAQTVQATELRAEPANGASALARLDKQAQVLVLQRQGGWYEVQTASGQRGWLPLLSLRFDKSAQARSSDLGNLLNLGQTTPASGVATGVRGISDEELRSAKGSLPDNVQTLEGFAATPGQARSFAQQGGLRSKTLPYANR